MRRVKKIHQLRDYIDVQLRELDSKFDLEWKEWLQKKRKSNSLASSRKLRMVRSPPTAPHLNFMDEPLLHASNSFDDIKNPIQIIYKTLANNQRMIDSLKMKIKDLPLSLNKHETILLKGFKVNEYEKLLSNMMMESLNINKPQNKIVIQCLAPKQKSLLKSFLENRHSVPIRACGPPVNNDQSRFLSVLEKIKSKEHKNLSLPDDLNITCSSQNDDINQSIEIIKNPTKLHTSLFEVSNQSSTLVSTILPNPEPIINSQIEPESILKTVFEDISPAISPITEKNFNLPSFSSSNPDSVSKVVTSSESKLRTSSSSLSALTTPTSISLTNQFQLVPKPKISTTCSSNGIPTFTFSLPPSSLNLNIKHSFSNHPNNPLTTSLPSSTVSSPFTNSINQLSISKGSSSISTTSSALSSLTIPTFSTSLFGTIDSNKKENHVASKPAFSFLNSLSSSTPITTLSHVFSSTSDIIVTTTSNFLSRSLTEVTSETNSDNTLKALLKETTSEQSSLASSSSFPLKTDQEQNSSLLNKTVSSTWTTLSGFTLSNSTTSQVYATSTTSNYFASSSGDYSFSQPTFSFNKPASASQAGLFSSPSIVSSSNSSIPNTQLSTSTVIGENINVNTNPNSFGNALDLSSLSTSQSTLFSVSQLMTSSASENTKTFSFAHASSMTKLSPFTVVSTPTTQPSSIEDDLNKSSICSPLAKQVVPNPNPSPGNIFGSFSFGGNTSGYFTSTAPSIFRSNTTTTESIFASPVLNSSIWSHSSFSNQSQGLFTSPTNNTSSATTNFQTSSIPVESPSGFGSPAKFNNSFFGQSPFGGTQTFGGPPTFGGSATFGSSSPFSSPGSGSGFGQTK